MSASDDHQPGHPAMPSSRHDLHLHEQLLLLVLRDRKGTVDYRAGFYNLAMGGAILAELAFAEVVRIEESRKAFVEAAPATGRPRDEIMAEALDRVRNSKKRRRASAWVSTFGNLKASPAPDRSRALPPGHLRTKESQILLVFRRKLYPTIDPGPERELIDRLREAVMGDGEIEAGLGVILSLAHATGSLRIHFERKELKARKARLKAITKGRCSVQCTGTRGVRRSHPARRPGRGRGISGCRRRHSGRGRGQHRRFLFQLTDHPRPGKRSALSRSRRAPGRGGPCALR